MKKTKKYIWDYDFKSLNLKDKRALLWYLKRKIEYGDWENLDKRTLKKYLPQLKLDPYLKDILKDFLKKYARNTKEILSEFQKDFLKNLAKTELSYYYQKKFIPTK